MNRPTGTWTVDTVGGHPCDLFQPAIRHASGYVVLYLHEMHPVRLRDQPAFEAEFERHGLSVVAPDTRRSWWTDRICPEFDAHLTAQQHVLRNVLPFIEQRWGVRPPRIALLGTSMGGQGALKLAYRYPNLFPVVAAISPAIDFQKRRNGGVQH